MPSATFSKLLAVPEFAAWPPQAQCECALVTADSLLHQARFVEADELLDDAEALARDHDLKLLQARLLGTRALLKHHRGELTVALRLHQEEERQFRELAEPRGLAVSLSNQATLFREIGNPVFATGLVRESRAICEAIGDARLELACIGNEALAAADAGHFEEAEPLYRRVLELAKESGDSRTVATTLLNQANLMRRRECYADAEELCFQAEALCKEVAWAAGYVNAVLIRAALPAYAGQRGALLLEEVARACAHNGLPELERVARESLQNGRQDAAAAVLLDRYGAAEQRAKLLYEDLHNSGVIWLGPRAGIPEWEAERIDTFQARIAEVLKEVTTTSDRAYACPSPWHAALLLLALQKRSLSAEPFEQQAMVFRGQRDYRWPLQASLRRTGVDVEFEIRCFEAFSAGLARFFERRHEDEDLSGTRVMDPGAHLAAAQHYGLKTDLLDFTTDPSVAVTFANQAARGDIAIVHGLPFRRALSRGLRILLPHPFFQRLFVQRGLFVDTSEPFAPRELRELCTEVRFPASPDFRIFRHETPVESLVPSSFFERVIAQIRAKYRGVAASLDGAALDAIFAEAGELPEASDAGRRKQVIADSMLELWQSVYTLSVFDGTDGKQKLDGGALWELVRDNRTIVLMLVRTYRMAMHVIEITQEGFQRDPLNESLATALELFARYSEGPPPPVIPGAWGNLLLIPQTDLANVVSKLHESHLFIEISQLDKEVWCVFSKGPTKRVVLPSH